MSDDPYEFDPTRHGHFQGDDIYLFSQYDAYGMGVSAGLSFMKERVLLSQHPGSCETCGHSSDCALHSEPAMSRDFCNCGKFPPVDLAVVSDE